MLINATVSRFQKKKVNWQMVIPDEKKQGRWGWSPEDVKPPPMSAFTVLKRRWVVERTFALGDIAD